MNMEIKRIKLDNIFCSDFDDLVKNNQIDFSKSGIAIIYGPNGIGKTSLARVFRLEPKSEYKLLIDGVVESGADSNLFWIIEDQNCRNIISGSTEDFVLGENIRRENELKNIINEDFNHIFKDEVIPILKSNFGISTKKSKFFKIINNSILCSYITDLANSKSKGNNIDKNEFLINIQALTRVDIPEFEQSKFTFLVNDYQGEHSIIEEIFKLNSNKFKQDNDIRKIEENDEAIKILNKYDYLDECIVCDSDIDRLNLLDRKMKNKNHIYEHLDESTKAILDNIVLLIDESNDPFNIKGGLLSAIKLGNYGIIELLIDTFNNYFDIYDRLINNLFVECLTGKSIVSNYSEYSAIIKEKPVFSEEDIMFIEKFINECIEKKIELKRNTDTNDLNIFLGNEEFLNKDRRELQLSNGEQNFISLAFELLKAKKNNAKIIVLDDPISSFDSIYKNKIAYSIIKFLEKKNQIILTHSTELIKLLEHQKNNCFNLYLLNNTEGEENGFIAINKDEQSIMLYIYKLLNLFRSEIVNHIIDERNYVISTIPFMRGYCQIIDDKKSRDMLTKVMHGYEKDKINITEIYNNIFKTGIIKKSHIISACDILAMDVNQIEILDKEAFPLLNKTLRHTITYLFLRLSVEEKLVKKFSINTNQNETLSKIINKAYQGTDLESITKRIFLLSRKTLLNEFNHFEVDMNIFQPAIDISDSILKREKDDILQFLNTA